MKIRYVLNLKEETALKVANFLKQEHKPIVIDYKKKFGLAESDFIGTVNIEYNVENIEEKIDIAAQDDIEDSVIVSVIENLSSEDKALQEAIKQYRNSKAREQGLEYFKYHFIFSNAVILELIKQKPETVEKLYSIKGLGQNKIDSYGSDIIDIIKQKKNYTIEVAASVEEPVSLEDNLRRKLKHYRLETAKAENIKAYIVFNNEQMEEIIAIKPNTKEELLKIKGFGEIKVEKYGEGILKAIKNL